MKLVILLLFSLSLFSHAEEALYEIPEGSPLTLKTDSEFPYLVFDGSATLSGKYEVSCEFRCPNVTFEPDETSVQLVPYLLREGKPQRVKIIGFTNDATMAKSLLGEELYSKLEPGLERSYVGKAIITVSGYNATYECDSPSYFGKFQDLNTVITQPTLTASSSSSGC